jgi:cytochrome c-type biogenesis protein CcmH
MIGYLMRSLAVLGFILAANNVFAAIEVHEFKTELDRQRYQSFIDELRCPKCQNQNLSGSDSPIAQDLRHELYGMIEDGRSDREIVDFMVERYGEFILYKPRLTASTLFLWALPIVLLLFGGGILALMVRRRRQIMAAGETTLSRNEQERLDKLLNPQLNGAQSKNNKHKV